MIDKQTRAWVGGLGDKVGEHALVVQLTQLPTAELAGLKTRRERQDRLAGHLTERLGPVIKQHALSHESVRVLGATGQAIITAPPKKLEELVAGGGLLDRASDLKVLPNQMMPGVDAAS